MWLKIKGITTYCRLCWNIKFNENHIDNHNIYEYNMRNKYALTYMLILDETINNKTVILDSKFNKFKNILI